MPARSKPRKKNFDPDAVGVKTTAKSLTPTQRVNYPGNVLDPDTGEVITPVIFSNVTPAGEVPENIFDPDTGWSGVRQQRRKIRVYTV